VGGSSRPGNMSRAVSRAVALSKTGSAKQSLWRWSICLPQAVHTAEAVSSRIVLHNAVAAYRKRPANQPSSALSGTYRARSTADRLRPVLEEMRSLNTGSGKQTSHSYRRTMPSALSAKILVPSFAKDTVCKGRPADRKLKSWRPLFASHTYTALPSSGGSPLACIKPLPVNTNRPSRLNATYVVQPMSLSRGF
jgi:hypothetical protein